MIVTEKSENVFEVELSSIEIEALNEICLNFPDLRLSIVTFCFSNSFVKFISKLFKNFK